MVCRSAFARNELLVAFTVVALLLGLLARTIYKVHEAVARTGSQAPAARVSPGPVGQLPRDWAPPELGPGQAAAGVHASRISGQVTVARERRAQ
jgi:hypothetical protein